MKSFIPFVKSFLMLALMMSVGTGVMASNADSDCKQEHLEKRIVEAERKLEQGSERERARAVKRHIHSDLEDASDSLYVDTAAKHEFRGTWISTVFQDKYASMSPSETRAYFRQLLDTLQSAGINVVLFQVRAEADAWYKSSYEPWSRLITGKSGKNPGWDPLRFMVEQCHLRNMDIHAWINPYRVRQTAKPLDSKDAFIRKHTSWIIRYGNSMWLDPGLPECRAHIVKVVRELVHDYDIDGLHMDDYFYPYPVSGELFHDEKSFARYGRGMELADWRRNNVNQLVEELSDVIHEEKPWVQFGISPFGIHRNQKQDPDGSQTNGLSNYDELYADALTWMREGWIDYCVPQLYWEIGHKLADYDILIEWWRRHSYGTTLVVGQDVARSMKSLPDGYNSDYSWQLEEKIYKQQSLAGVHGSCFFPAYELEADNNGVLDILRKEFYASPALMTTPPSMTSYQPEPVYGLELQPETSLSLRWNFISVENECWQPVSFAVYCFEKEEGMPVDYSYVRQRIQDPATLIGMTRHPYYELVRLPVGEWVYAVTSVSRSHVESDPNYLILEVKER